MPRYPEIYDPDLLDSLHVFNIANGIYGHKLFGHNSVWLRRTIWVHALGHGFANDPYFQWWGR